MCRSSTCCSYSYWNSSCDEICSHCQCPCSPCSVALCQRCRSRWHRQCRSSSAAQCPRRLRRRSRSRSRSSRQQPQQQQAQQQQPQQQAAPTIPTRLQMPVQGPPGPPLPPPPPAGYQGIYTETQRSEAAMAGVRQQERLLSELLRTGSSGFGPHDRNMEATADPDSQRLLEAQAAAAVRQMARGSQWERYMDAAGAGTRRSSQPYQRSPWSTQEVPYPVHRVRRPEHGPGQAPVTRSKHIMVFCQVESLPRVEFGVWFPVPVLHNALSYSSKADASEKLIRPAASEDEAATVPEMHFCFGADLKSGWALGAGVGVFLVCPFPRTSRLPESTMGHWLRMGHHQLQEASGAAARRRPGRAQSRWWRRPQSRSPRPSLLGVGRPARPRRRQRRQGRPCRPRPVPQPPRPTSLSGRRARTRAAFWMRSRSSHLRPSRMRNRSVLLLPVPLKPIFVACCGEVQSWLDVAVWQRRQVDCSFACLQSC